MFIYIFGLICAMIAPLAMIAAGAWFVSSPPEPGAIGYRSALSVKNGDTWAEAHRISGRIMLVMGIIGIAAAAVAFICETASGIAETAVLIILAAQAVIQTVMFIVMFLLTESRLKKIFTADGRRRLP